jgi:chromosome segregation ATPase
MTFLEVFQAIVLPAAGAVGGLTALIIFLLSKPKRQAETKKASAEGDQVIMLTAAKLHQMTTEAAAQALEAQRALIDNLQEEVSNLRAQVVDQACKLGERDAHVMQLKQKVDRFEYELDVREENIENLKKKLQEYQEENKRYKAENVDLRSLVEAQEKRIKELEDELDEIKQRFQENKDE